MKKVLALATCFNRKEKTIKSIKSLIVGNPLIDFSFIICDDNSTDGTYEELLKIEAVDVVRGTGSLFWAGGMREAIDKALSTNKEYNYCLLFNDDVSFFNHAIEKLIPVINDTVSVGPTCDDNGNLSYGGIKKTSNFLPKYKKVKGSECDTFNANCVLIPWHVFKQIGNFDKIYTHQFADYDYGFAIRNAGYSITASDDFVGLCNNNKVDGTFNDESLNRINRIKLMKDPKKGLPIREYYHYLSKNYNFFTAVVFSMWAYVKIITV